MAGGKLTALEVTKLKAPGMYGDGGGLYLQVSGDGKERIAKSWIFRYRFRGHTSKAGKPLAREMGLGSVERGPSRKPVSGPASAHPDQRP